MDAILVLVVVAFLVLGIPMLCRMAIRRMGASEGMREWLHAYGPRLPFLEPQKQDEEEGET